MSWDECECATCKMVYHINEMLRHMANSLPSGYLVTEDGKLRFVHDDAEPVLGEHNDR